jgi:hypothetical protein
MRKYPLNLLIVARARREEAAAKELKIAEGRLRVALAEEAKAKDDLDAYRKKVQIETERRWANLLGSETKASGLLDFREGLAELDRRIADFEIKLIEAQKVAQDKRLEAEKARLELIARRKAKEKLESHRQTWLEAEAIEDERLEGLEIEEFSRPASLMGF